MRSCNCGIIVDRQALLTFTIRSQRQFRDIMVLFVSRGDYIIPWSFFPGGGFMVPESFMSPWSMCSQKRFHDTMAPFVPGGGFMIPWHFFAHKGGFMLPWHHLFPEAVL